MIRPSLIAAILETLDRHAFLAREDFQVAEYANKSGDPCVSIKYRYDPRSSFNFHVPKAKTKTDNESWERYRFNCTMSPGRESSEETLVVSERGGLLTEINEWIVRTYDDVLSAPIVRQLSYHASTLEDIKERLDSLPDEPLSEDDIRELRDGLEKLKVELGEQLRQQGHDKIELTKRVEELGRDIALLKTTLESLTKRRWAELFMARVHKWTSKLSLKQVAAGARVMKKLLPESAAADGLQVVAEVADALGTASDGKPRDDIPS